MNYLVFVVSLLALSVVGFFTYGLHSLGPIMITFYRVLFALPFYLVLQSIIIKKDNVNKGMITNQARIYYFCIGMIFGVDISIWVASILYTTIYNSVLLSNLFPIFTVFISRFILKDVVKPFVYIIIALVSCGVFITVYSDIQVDSNERVVVSTPGYLRNFTTILASEPKRNIANYMLWRAARASIGFLNKVYELF